MWHSSHQRNQPVSANVAANAPLINDKNARFGRIKKSRAWPTIALAIDPLNAAADVIIAVAGIVEADPALIIELDINPLMVLAEGQGVVAADALISLNPNSTLNMT